MNWTLEWFSAATVDEDKYSSWIIANDRQTIAGLKRPMYIISSLIGDFQWAGTKMVFCSLMINHVITIIFCNYENISTTSLPKCVDIALLKYCVISVTVHIRYHNSDYTSLKCHHDKSGFSITMTSWWGRARWRLKSPASRLFFPPFIHAQIKENIKAPRHWPLCGEFTGDRWIPRTKDQ